ncbi:hypothetical protein [Kiloniella sp.]|uniref:hypothetical protein n=1 Tax=Kiloniella sp. TaxID=1938587 RepID=UPI003B028997
MPNKPKEKSSTYELVKISKDVLICCAEYIMNYQDVVDAMVRQYHMDWDKYTQEQFDIDVELIKNITDQYLSENKVPQEHLLAYSKVYLLVANYAEGKIPSLRSASAKKLLKNNAFVKFVDNGE